GYLLGPIEKKPPESGGFSGSALEVEPQEGLEARDGAAVTAAPPRGSHRTARDRARTARAKGSRTAPRSPSSPESPASRGRPARAAPPSHRRASARLPQTRPATAQPAAADPRRARPSDSRRSWCHDARLTD